MRNIDESVYDREVERLTAEGRLEKQYKVISKRLDEMSDMYRALENENKLLKCEIEKLNQAQVELPHEPIKVAEMLIDATEHRTNCMTGKEYDKPVYEKWRLKQIAGHLLVHCNANSED